MKSTSSSGAPGAGGLAKALMVINVLVAMSGGGALGAAALVSLNSGVAQLLPPPAAAAAPLVLPALAAAALGLALLLVAARHTPSVLYTYAALSLALAAAAGGAGGWLAVVVARAVLDNKGRIAATGLRLVANQLSGGLLGTGRAAAYGASVLNVTVGAAWAALTGLALIVGAAVAVVAARRASRTTI